MRGALLARIFFLINFSIFLPSKHLICHILFFKHVDLLFSDPRIQKINEGILTPMLSWALPGSPGLSLVLDGMQVKGMSREMGVSKLIVRYSSLHHFLNKMSLLGYI